MSWLSVIIAGILTYLTSLGYVFKDHSNNLYSLGHKIFEFGE